MRVLITGASGFAGGHLVRACVDAGDVVVGLSRSGRVPVGCGEGWGVDLRDDGALRAAVREIRPHVVYHLAALSSVDRSWAHPGKTLADNGAIAVAVLEALRQEAPDAVVLWVSSGEVYGAPPYLPVDEDARLAPTNPYAISKLAGDLLAAVYAEAHGLKVICARAFNHAGPGQPSIFVLSSIARQAAAGRMAGDREIRVVTGNPDSRRDFTDVRDVVRAYRLLAERARPGVYNVSSGRSVSVTEQVSLLRELVAPVSVTHEVDPARLRPHEVLEVCGSHQQLSDATGWQPEIPLRATLADMIEWWAEELATSAPGNPGRAPIG